ncbi:hypothetical protein AB0G04_24390 [Actinoplanes sp. NPDC023801]|uniref:hypothetical protein n=1 Tax=Actinoplanes sp. NPDC023801 TaxID=3154595 RepID=UPI0033C73D93
MPNVARPLLAIRLIGPTDTVQVQQRYLTAYLDKLFGGQATVRSSTHSARRTGEIRVYVTVTRKETHGSTENDGTTLGDRPGR